MLVYLCKKSKNDTIFLKLKNINKKHKKSIFLVGIILASILFIAITGVISWIFVVNYESENESTIKTDLFIKNAKSLNRFETSSLILDNTTHVTAGFDLSKLGHKVSYDTGWVSLQPKYDWIELNLPKPKILTITVDNKLVTNLELIENTTKKACREGIFDTANKNATQHFTAILDKLKYRMIVVHVAKMNC